VPDPSVPDTHSPSPTATRGVVPAAWLQETMTRIFAATGLDAEPAATVAEALLDADLRGLPSHGAMLVPMYVDRLRAGSVTTAARGRVVVDGGAMNVIDADHALGILTGDQAMAIASARAVDFGVGIVVVRHAFHFGAASRYAETAAHAGLIGIAAANTRPMMPAPGGARPVVGNNPLAIAVPRAGGDPISVDMALSEVALGRIRLAAAEGRAIPATWATDAQGTPTTDPEAAIAGMLLPIGGAKGFGLAFMIDVLTGVLSDGASGSAVRGLYADPAVPNDCAHLFAALDPDAFDTREGFAGRVATLAAEVAASPSVPGAAPVRLPGQLATGRRAAGRHRGITLDPRVLRSLHDTAALVGITIGAPA
jgi:LDH2 family malate/lactate/ureidoglycolate dehydrogenase